MTRTEAPEGQWRWKSEDSGGYISGLGAIQVEKDANGMQYDTSKTSMYLELAQDSGGKNKVGEGQTCPCRQASAS